MLILSGSSCAEMDDGKLDLHWLEFPSLPPSVAQTVQPGLAGSLAGAHGPYVLVAGGANFEEGMPWLGGKKSYHDEIYLLEKTASAKPAWRTAAQKLPFPIAYAACISLAQGFVSVGGEDENHPIKNVFLFSFSDGQIKIKNLPDLPTALSSAGATSVGSEVFVAGGLDASGASVAFYSIDMTKSEEGWRKLPPLPIPLSHSVVVSQNDGNEICIYVIGGRNKTTEVSTFLSSIWKYSPSAQRWTREGDITSKGKIMGLSAGTGIAVGSNHIVLFGGDPGIFFNQTERLMASIEKASGDERQMLLKAKATLLTNHPGFSKEVLAFNTLSKSWEKIGEMAGESPVTTLAFHWGDQILIPSGEVRPGIRTPKITGASIQLNM